MSEDKKGWPLLHSQLPAKALKALDKSVYNVSGLTDVNEGYLIQRLFASGLSWDWRIESQQYLGHEDRTSQGGNQYRVYFAAVHGVLWIDGRQWHGSGASDNRKLDAAFKGAATVAFKNACKVAGLTAELYLDGRAIDFIYDHLPEKTAPTREESETNGARAATAATTSTADAGTPLPSPSLAPTPKEVLERARQHVKPEQASYAKEDAVCPDCGRKEFLSARGDFCAKAKGGCGWPKAKGAKGVPITYGEWLAKKAAS